MANAARVREVLARRREDVEVGSPVDMGVSNRGGIAVRLPDGSVATWLVGEQQMLTGDRWSASGDHLGDLPNVTVGLVAETADRIEEILDDLVAAGRNQG